MGFQLVEKIPVKKILKRTFSNDGRTTSALTAVPKGHFAVYVGKNMNKRFVVPISYLSHPLFQRLLLAVEEEFGFEHPTGRLAIPCSEDYFTSLITLIRS